jgi:hypothetical protein
VCARCVRHGYHGIAGVQGLAISLEELTVSHLGTNETITASISTPDIPILASSPGVGEAVVSLTCRIFGLGS